MFAAGCGDESVGLCSPSGPNIPTGRYDINTLAVIAEPPMPFRRCHALGPEAKAV
jgi:hypothetical protein